MNRTRTFIAGLAAAAALAVVLAVVLTDHSSARGAQPRTTVKTAASSFGRIVVDGRGRTVYLFERDKRGRSACSGICATYWPPLLVRGKAVAGAGARASLLGTTKRSDGSRQVTYGGHPLYHYVGDSAAGQATGQGSTNFGGNWYVIAPSGHKVDEDAGS